MKRASAWDKLKISIRVWIERTNGDEKSSSSARATAWLIWSIHETRSTIKNLPRVIRIHLRLTFGPFWQSQDVQSPTVDTLEGARRQIGLDELDTELDRLAAIAPVDKVAPAMRKALADEMATVVARFFPAKFVSRTPPNTLERLNSDGIVEIPELRLSNEHAEEIRSHLEKQPVYSAHVANFSDGLARKLDDPESRKSPFGSYKIDQTIASPRLLDLAFDERALGIAESYLGSAPTIYSVHAWWSFPGHRMSGPQVFHRDPDDHKFLALFVYLTDVNGGTEGGEHEFIAGTHRLETTASSLGGDSRLASEFFPPKALGTVADEGPLYRRIFNNKIRSVTGKAGSVFVADTYGLHRGIPPTRTPRLVCWIRYGLRKTPTYDTNENHPIPFDWTSGRIPDDAYHRFVSRLILE